MLSKPIEPQLAMDKLTVRLGGRHNHKLSRSTGLKVRTTAAKASELIRPNVHYRIHRIQYNDKQQIHVDGRLKLSSRKLAKTLKNAAEIVCFVATIGSGIEREIARLMDNNNLSEAYILDALGSIAVEDVTEQFQRCMNTELVMRGKCSTLRFSPGYCDWPITDQKKLFRLLSPGKIGVRLTDSSLMIPRKSISGVFGIVPKETPPYNPCLDCRKDQCEARRISETTH